MDKLLGALSLCRKAGKLVMGFDPVAESAAKGKAQLVLLAADLAGGSRKKALRFCDAAGLEPRALPLTQQELLAVTPKRTGVFAVIDKGLAQLVERQLAPAGPGGGNPSPAEH